MIVEQNYQTNATVGDPYLCQRIDGRRAKSIARKFLEHYHSLIIFKDAVLDEMIWTVIMDVGHADEHIIHVKVDAETGKILGYL
ncbi:MAG TPA: hypothetical protein VNX68_01610 [Nitrosopumilaceae archaeon]|nr:hypothetical protein [Nitrosopumilaceae archaeon]